MRVIDKRRAFIGLSVIIVCLIIYEHSLRQNNSPKKGIQLIFNGSDIKTATYGQVTSTQDIDAFDDYNDDLHADNAVIKWSPKQIGIDRLKTKIKPKNERMPYVQINKKRFAYITRQSFNAKRYEKKTKTLSANVTQRSIADITKKLSKAKSTEGSRKSLHVSDRGQKGQIKSKSIEWRRVSPTEAYERFSPLSSPSCKNVCKKKRDQSCQAKTRLDWDRLLSKKQLNGVPLYGENEFMFPFEKKYLSFPPLEDLKTLPDQKQSVVYHLDSHGVARILRSVQCHHLDTLTFRVDLIDSYGHNRRHGGDDIRVWITGNPKNQNVHDFSSAGQVQDLKNGSYLATVTCAWPGFAMLKVGLAYPREYIRAALDNARRGVHVLVTGTFQRGHVEEDTICQSHPNIPGRPCLCNLTDRNELPFFCGRPLDQRLSCEDFLFTQSIPSQARLVYTEAESVISRTMTRNPSAMLIVQKVIIEIDNEDQSKLPRRPCHQVNRKESWDFDSPQGFWSNDDQWTSFICKAPELKSSWVQDCLQNTTVWLLGDSNTRIMKEEMLKLMGEGSKRKNIKLLYFVHELTFHSNYRRKIPRETGIGRILDKIPSTGNHYVSIHYYLHPSRSHISAIYFRLKELRKKLIDLLKRNPNVYIALRGPHISAIEVLRNHMLGGDVLGNYIIAFYHDIFRNLKDKVLFLDGWEMTIAMENSQYHPDIKFTRQLIRTALSFKCR